MFGVIIRILIIMNVLDTEVCGRVELQYTLHIYRTSQDEIEL